LIIVLKEPPENSILKIIDGQEIT